jgi:hypothetical protein
MQITLFPLFGIIMIRTTGKGEYLWIGVIVTIASLVTIGSTIAFDRAYAGEYDRSQATTGTNECGNQILPLNILCSNTGSQVQGDENAVALDSIQRAPISIIPDIITDGFLIIKEAIIKPFGQPNPPVGNTAGGFDAFLRTHGLIPENGEGGAFGYGVLTTNTDSGLGLVVATTHQGVLDSQEQSNINDPIWHNHMVKLGNDPNNCGTDMAVAQITWEQPGDVQIQGKTAHLTNIPNQFSSPSSFNPNGPDESYEPGNDVQNVVSFKLVPIPAGGGSAPDGTIQAVCVTDITPAEDIIIQ